MVFATPSPPAAIPDRRRLRALVDAMVGQPVLMLVDPVADRYVSGVPKRISREAPVLILRYEGERLIPGGGANAVANVAALGGRPLPLGVVGDDASGRGLLDELADRGVDVSGLRRRAGYLTPTKVRILGGARHALKQQIVRYDVEDEVELDDADRKALASTVEGWRRQLDSPPRVAVVSDYGYGSAVPSLLPLLRRGLAEDGLVVCDSRYRLGEFQAAENRPDSATPNEEEAEALHGGPLGEAGEGLEEAGEGLRRRLSLDFLLITRGNRGMSLFQPEGIHHLSVHGTDQVADVTGAGDTVIGTFSLALAAGGSPLEAALLANYAGGVVVMKMGTATLSTDELAAAVDADPAPLASVHAPQPAHEADDG